MIIIETPAPPTRERLVLVPVGETHAHCRDATPEDLERGGYVPSVGHLPRREVETAVSDAMDLQRRLIEAEGHAAELHDRCETLRAERNAAQDRAERLERERDEARAELARLTAAAEGEPTPGQLLDACPPSGGRLLACYRLGVAHERAWQPAQDRATDEELADLYAREYDAQAHQTRDTFSKSHNDCRRAGILAVAARVRGERCLVARTVGDQLIDSVSIDRVTGGRIRVRVVRRRDPIANPDGESVEAFCKRRSDVPATLARLLGEVSRG